MDSLLVEYLTVPPDLVSFVATVNLTLLTVGVLDGLSLEEVNKGQTILTFITNTTACGIQDRKTLVKLKRI